MTRRRILALAAAVAAAVAAFLAFGPRGGKDAPAPPPGTQPGTQPGTPSAPPEAPEFGDDAEAVTFAIAAPVDDHVSAEPCLLVPGGGLTSLRAYYDRVEGRSPPMVPILMGDATRVPGPAGALVASLRYSDPCDESKVSVVAAGLSDLSLGADFLRRSLSQRGFAALCANATDSDGAPLLRGWALLEAGGRSVGVVSVAADSLGPELLRAGSDVRLGPAADAAQRALADVRRRAAELGRRLVGVVLLCHGTTEETADLAGRVPGFTFAVAARGGDLPSAEPVRAGDVPVFTVGRRLRFGWSVTVDRGVTVAWHLDRLGMELLARGSPAAGAIEEESEIVRGLYVPPAGGTPDQRPEDPRGTYVGTDRCAECHTKEHAEHVRSPHGGLSAGIGPAEHGRVACLGCHVTAPFFRTGWRGKGEGERLVGVGCETCHGPASAHLAQPGPGWGRVSLTQCRECHTRDRSPEFEPEEIWRQWGHALK